MKKINFDRIKHIHMMGIGGCGVSAIAKISHELGYKVSGSDLKENSNTIRLADLGIQVFLKHEEKNLRGADLLVVSSAIDGNNPELLAAKSSGIPILRRAQMLAYILSKHKTALGVAGTHGKTTTTSMITKILLDNNFDPTFMIGGETDYVDGNARMGKGNYAVAEADESDGSFLDLDLDIGIVTNIEPDHMDYFKNDKILFEHFVEFAEKIKKKNGLLITSDHPGCIQAFSGILIRKITYGFGKGTDFSAVDFEFADGGSKFKVLRRGELLGEMTISVPGEQNISDALAAVAFGMEVGISFESIAEALHTYHSVKRRFQIIGEINGITIVDDYAHHPTEIAATLRGARLGYPSRRLIAVFQPHRYSRTFKLAADFAQAFSDADLVILTDIYSAGEAPIPNIDGKTIFDLLPKKDNAIYIQKKERIVDHLLPVLNSGDMLLILGAGDINNIGKEILNRLKMK